ncbi:ABC transporter permease [Novosphingobium sp.]|uniref:ABC transporter permease n=1 Tax=Novosphingobium sp. TaxID=1874826 RepID=UPI0026041C87|nr:ABC transporter permease [Novosphingobium sp.]
MLAFLFRRLGFLAVVLLGVSLITFAIAHLAPGDPARLVAGPQASAEAVARVRIDLGLDQPVAAQYTRYLGRLVHGDLGTSNVDGRPVAEAILAKAPASLELMGAALLLAVLAGIPLGMLAALRRNGAADRTVRIMAVAGAAIPAFWFGSILIILFYRELGWFPASGRFTGTPPPAVTGFLTVDALLAGDLAGFRTACAHLALPVFTLALLDLGLFARLTRNQMLGVMAQDYIRVARASGLPEGTIVRVHALRNALSPLISVVAASLAAMLYGSVSVETVFGWPGAGQFVVSAIGNLDFPVVMGFAVIASAAYVVVNLLADLLLAAVDPRVRLA